MQLLVFMGSKSLLWRCCSRHDLSLYGFWYSPALRQLSNCILVLGFPDQDVENGHSIG